MTAGKPTPPPSPSPWPAALARPAALSRPLFPISFDLHYSARTSSFHPFPAPPLPFRISPRIFIFNCSNEIYIT